MSTLFERGDRPTGKLHCGDPELCQLGVYSEERCDCTCDRCGPWSEWFDLHEHEPKSDKKTNHVRLIPPGTFLCLHCGADYEMALPVPIDLMVAAMKSFSDTHSECQLLERGVACSYCFQFGHVEEDCTTVKYDDDWRKWWHGPDTGTSSKTICCHLAGKGAPMMGPNQESIPRDASDFGRCHRLLHAMKGWRERIGEMQDVPGWAKLVGAWDELEKLYLEEHGSGMCPKLYKRMKELEL